MLAFSCVPVAGLQFREVLFAVEQDEEERAAGCERPRVLDLKYLVFGAGVF